MLSTYGSDGLYLGPGGQDLVEGPDGGDYLVFHGWDKDYTYRALHVAPVEWADGLPSVVLPG